MPCVVLFHRAHNVVFFLGKRNVHFKHLIAGEVDVGANSPWGETGSYLIIELYLWAWLINWWRLVENILVFLFYFSKVKAVNPVKMVTNGFQILTKNRTYTFVSYIYKQWMKITTKRYNCVSTIVHPCCIKPIVAATRYRFLRFWWNARRKT